jgi:hypothetical protein
MTNLRAILFSVITFRWLYGSELEPYRKVLRFHLLLIVLLYIMAFTIGKYFWRWNEYQETMAIKNAQYDRDQSDWRLYMDWKHGHLLDSLKKARIEYECGKLNQKK